MEMTESEANKIVNPAIKEYSFDEGFKVYMKFYKQPIECGTVLKVKGYLPKKLNGFDVILENGNESDLTEEFLKDVVYKNFLEGKTSGDFDW